MDHRSTQPPETSAESGKADRHITTRAIAIGGITIAAIFYGIDIAVKSQLPLIVIGAFMMWLFVNILLKKLLPFVALSRSELLTIFGMLWVAGTISGSGWMSYWALIMATPGVLRLRGESVGGHDLRFHALACLSGDRCTGHRRILAGVTGRRHYTLGRLVRCS